MDGGSGVKWGSWRRIIWEDHLNPAIRTCKNRTLRFVMIMIDGLNLDKKKKEYTNQFQCILIVVKVNGFEIFLFNKFSM